MKKLKTSKSLILGISFLLITFLLTLVTLEESSENLVTMDKTISSLLESSLALHGSTPPKILCEAGAGGGQRTGKVDGFEGNRFRWGLETIRAPQAWKTTKGDEKITIAVIDSGVDYKHQSLKGRIWNNNDEIPNNGIDDDNNGFVDDIHGWDFRDNDNSSLKGTPIHWHGTFVAGLIGAAIDQSGRAGVAPRVKIMDIRFLDSHNYFYNTDWNKFAKAIHYAVDNGADVINLSIYSNYEPPTEVKEAIQRAVDKGMIIVGIVGNNSSVVQYPGKYESVIAVTAINRSDQLANYSNVGPEIAIAAPGDNVLSITPGGGYSKGRGTSFAAPHVTGTIALLLSVNHDLDYQEVLRIFSKTSKDLGQPGKDRKYGYGLLDTKLALEEVVNSGI